jgi:glycosyltransferase involved in cell wall biosynthesis
MDNEKSLSPLVSIIVPAYNLSDLISETLDSVLSQSYANFEVLVVDDASTDDTKDIIESYAEKDNRVIPLSNAHTKGVSGARNTGIDNAKGEWLAFLDGDDLWPADSLSARIDCLNDYPEAQLISGDYSRFEESIETLAPSNAATNDVWKDYFSESLKTGKIFCLKEPVKHFLRAALVHTGTVLVESGLVKKLGGFDENLLNSEDTQLWLRISARVDELIFIPELLLFYRQRSGSLTNSTVSMYHYAPAAYETLLGDSAFKNYKRKVLDNICHYISLNSYFYRNNKQYWQALKWSFRYVLCRPLSKQSWKNFIASCVYK